MTPPPKKVPPILSGILREKPIGIGIAKKLLENGIDSTCDLDNFGEPSPNNENQKNH
jgi:hypothetical protein